MQEKMTYEEYIRISQLIRTALYALESCKERNRELAVAYTRLEESMLWFKEARTRYGLSEL